MNPGISLTKAVAQLVEKLNGWLTVTVKMLPNLVVAVIFMAVILWLRHPIARLVERAVLRVTGHRHIARLLATMTRLGVIATGLILVLDILNLDRAVASLLAGVGILGIALGFASQDIAANFMAGVLLHFEHPFRLGDRIKSGEFLGYIDSMNLRATIIRGRQGERITVPNKNILGNPITNYYITGIRRIDLYIGIDYTPDLQEAEDLALAAVEALGPPLRDPDYPVEFFYEEVKSTTIVFRIRFWTHPEQPIFLRARSEAIKAINQTFKAHGITRPSDVVTLDFGITGGVSLREQLEGARLSLSVPGEEKAGKGKDREET
jgi:small conductance mechanosensitive channel